MPITWKTKLLVIAANCSAAALAVACYNIIESNAYVGFGFRRIHQNTTHTPISEPNQYAIDHNATHISLCIGSWTQALVLHWLPINQYQRSFIPCYKCTSRDANCLVLFCFGIDLAHSNCLVWIQCVHIRFICNKLEFCWWFHTNRSTHTQLFFWFEQNKMFKCIQFLPYVHIHSTIENETEH